MEGTLGITRTSVHVVAGDPGIKNFGLCHLELIGVGSVLDPGGSRTRIMVPYFVVHAMGVMNLDVDMPVTGKGRLVALKRHLSTERAMNQGMGHYRQALSFELVGNERWASIFKRYPCPMTRKDELPVVAIENQLDVTDVDPKDRMRDGDLRTLVIDAKHHMGDGSADALPAWANRVVQVMARGQLRYPPRDDFNKARMYTLSNALAAVIEGHDVAVGAGGDRLVINAAKKHRIASDNSLTYTERKRESINLMYAMLREQVHNRYSSIAEKENGTRWLAYLDRLIDEDHQKLDDIADAFNLAIEVALKIFKKWHKKMLAPGQAPPPCFAPVTVAERAASPVLATEVRGPPAAPKRKRAAPTKKKEKKQETTVKKAPRKEPARGKKRSRASGDAEDGMEGDVRPKKRARPAAKKRARQEEEEEDDEDDASYSKSEDTASLDRHRHKRPRGDGASQV